jgi:acyl CoA:acetate/3-ketoacid CoA transferase beta subunit
VLVPASASCSRSRRRSSTEATRQIGENIAGLVEDGSTVEFGIGRIPHGVVEFLKKKKDLGIHTEMLTDSIIDLIESGAVTGARKRLDRGLIVASFCMGSQRLYDYVKDNPLFCFRPTEYVNDPGVIAKQHKMVAINTALEIDLTGQVCADSLGGRFYPGIGGQVDFNRGAARSFRGKPIIALPATAHDGEISRIVTRLSPGAGVVTTRGAVHYIVTEYGVAYLHGKSIQERLLALISIAHPASGNCEGHRRSRAPETRTWAGGVSPPTFASMALADGTQINFRPSGRPTSPLCDLFTRIAGRSTASCRHQAPAAPQADFVYIDHRSEFTLVGTVPEAHGEAIVAVGAYYLDPRTNRAEVAFVVRDQWQNRGIGLSPPATHPHRPPQRHPRVHRRGPAENKAMQAVFAKETSRSRPATPATSTATRWSSSEFGPA